MRARTAVWQKFQRDEWVCVYIWRWGLGGVCVCVFGAGGGGNGVSCTGSRKQHLNKTARGKIPLKTSQSSQVHTHTYTHTLTIYNTSVCLCVWQCVNSFGLCKPVCVCVCVCEGLQTSLRPQYLQRRSENTNKKERYFDVFCVLVRDRKLFFRCACSLFFVLPDCSIFHYIYLYNKL